MIGHPSQVDEPAGTSTRRAMAPTTAKQQETLVQGSSGGHFQLNYEASRIPSADKWNVPQQESYMEYQLKKQAQSTNQMGKLCVRLKKKKNY